jgi:hypothetical protein
MDKSDLQPETEKASTKARRATLIIKITMAVAIVLPLLLAWLTGAFSF